MRRFRVAVAALVAMFAWAGVATAAVDADLRPHHFKKRAAHWQSGMEPGLQETYRRLDELLPLLADTQARS